MELASTRQIGWARFIFRKYEKSPLDKYGHGVEIYHWDTFDSEFVNSHDGGPMDFVAEMISQIDGNEQIADVAKDLSPGWYEMVGQFWYEFDPGYDSPNGPAEPDAWWWIEDAKFLALTDEQASHYIPPPPPPPAQEWEHGTSDVEEGRRHHQCPSCKKWAHRCGNCGFFDWREEEFCSENCWKAAGSPAEPEDMEKTDAPVAKKSE